MTHQILPIPANKAGRCAHRACNHPIGTWRPTNSGVSVGYCIPHATLAQKLFGPFAETKAA